MQKVIIIICSWMFFIGTSVSAQNHPHLLVNQTDKEGILYSIMTNEWAAKAFQHAVKEIDPYVNRHVTDAAWMLDRYLMNRVSGKRYTNFVAGEGLGYVAKYSGDAPVPTVRVSPSKRPPITSHGTPYSMPKIEDLIPNDTAMSHATL